MTKKRKLLVVFVGVIFVFGIINFIPRTKDIYLIGPVNFTMVKKLVNDLKPTWLDYINDVDILNVHINSPGGYANEGLAIVDILNNLSVKTKNYIAEGFACSAGALILVSGPNNHRFATKNCMIMIHYAYQMNPMTGEKLPPDSGTKLINEMIDKIFLESTGNDYLTINKALSFDNFMTPEQAIEFGIIDSIIGYDNTKVKIAPLNPEFLKE